MNGHVAAKLGAIAAAASWGLCAAQYRADGQAVVAPTAAPEPKPALDVAPRFEQAYRRIGQPRIVLMWNRELSDRANSTVVAKQVTREVGKASSSAMDKATHGATESATLKDSDESFDRTKTISTGSETVEEPVRKVALSERHAAMLQQAFVAEMARGGVRFIDRALALRTTAATRHRGGGDAKLIETDALVGYGDLLMEVLLIEDKETPAGHGFEVRVKDLHRGHLVSSMYSRAIAAMPPQRPGAWVAGESGYEFRAPPPPQAPSLADVGAALARDVMLALGGNLEPSAQAPRGQR